MKTIITLDKANQPYGFPQLDGSGNLPSPYGRSYKVYTALLTQNGGDNALEVTGDSSLTKGVTYTIVENNQPVDLSSFGAPNNNVGTTFCSTLTGPINGDGPDSVILIYNTGAPVVTVLENTIGNIWFTYEGNGNYIINSDGLFTINKTWGISNCIFDGINFGFNIPVFLDFTVASNLPNAFYIKVQGGDFLGDSMMTNTPIEIRVYN